MNIVIFGATGRIGRVLVKQALAQNHAVTVLARDAERVVAQPGQLRVVVGNVLDRGAVERVVYNQDAVLCALGTTPDPGPSVTLSAGTAHILRAMAQFGVRRIVCLLSGWVFLAAHPPDMKYIVAEHRRQLEALRQSRLDWVAVCPLLVTDMPPVGAWRAQVGGLPPRARRIARPDVARFMLEQLADSTYLGEAVGVAE